MTEEQILIALLSLLLGFIGIGTRLSGYTNKRVGFALTAAGALAFVGVLVWWARDSYSWPVVVALGGGILLLGLLVLAVTGTVRRDRPALVLTPENGPGRVHVRVENPGPRSDFTASARMIRVEEAAPNDQFLQTYPLRWLATGKPTITLDSGAADALLIATSKREPGPHWETPLYEVRLEGYVEGEARGVDWRRWHGGEPDGSVTILLEVVVASSAAIAMKERYLVKSRKWGGLTIQLEATTPRLTL